MCNIKTITTAVVLALLLLHNPARAKKSRRIKRPKTEEDSTPQPSVVTYSTFGFNDVGSYDGFVPSSPDYASYLSSFNQDSATRLYAPAFPTAMDGNGFNSGYEPQAAESQPQPASENADPQHAFNFFNSQYDSGQPEQQQQAQDDYEQNTYELNTPIYGAKISHKEKDKQFDQFNSSQTMFGGTVNSGGEKYFGFQDVHESKPSFGESANSHFEMYNYAQTFPTTNVEESLKSPAADNSGKPSHPEELIENKFTPATFKPYTPFNQGSNDQNENSYFNSYQNSDNDIITSQYKETYEDDSRKTFSKPVPQSYQEFSINHIENTTPKHHLKSLKSQNEYKDRIKTKPSYFNNTDFYNWRTPFKGFDYANANKNSSTRYGSSEKRPNHDDRGPEMHTMIDLTNYKSPENDYSGPKKPTDLKEQSENYANEHLNYQENAMQDNDFYNQFKLTYSTAPTTTSNWGNFYKPTENTGYKNRFKRPQLSVDESKDEVVHIQPQKQKYHISKPRGIKPSEWSSYTRQNLYKNAKPLEEWNKEVATRFKSEEDLLGLRTHDTSHPTYIPSFKFGEDTFEEFQKYSSDGNYKNLVEKWRQSWLKSKYSKDYKDLYKEREVFGSDSKHVHVPVPKPYPIEVPHPVIVPVPQPYPVRVPVPKPVAIPVIKEIKVPIEKPMPYPVIKKVPYPVEKLVPYTVEKEVQVPVMKPYPVPVPHVRPVFHHTKTRDEMSPYVDGDLDDYLHKPDLYEPHPHQSKKVSYVKKTRGSRNRSRRPPSHYERNRRRFVRRPNLRREPPRSRRPRPPPNPPTLDWSYAPRFHDFEVDDFEHDDYYDNCRRNGNC